MPVSNSDIAEMFRDTADLLEIKGENRFRVLAYRNAAFTVESLSKNAADMIKNEEDLSGLPGIGKDLAGKIKDIADTGKFSVLEELRKEMPPGLGSIMRISGLGAKRVGTLYNKLNIKSIDNLKQAALDKKIRDIKGFGEKTEKSILEAISRIKDHEGGMKLSAALQIVDSLLQYLKQVKEVKKIEVAGSIRRRKETVQDADILAACPESTKIMDRFIKYDDVMKVTSRGDTKSSVLLRSGFQVDLRVVPEESFGAALQYFTGSKPHNVAIRRIGQKNDLKINEYGVFQGERKLAGETEKEIYEAIGLSYIEPELREDRGEIEASLEKRLPELISLNAVKGDLHTHTSLTDGRNSLEEMAEAAREMGYRYIANTEHSKHVAMVGGLDASRLKEQIKKIDLLNSRLSGFTILKSIELDILDDGSLDLPDSILKELDFTVCSIHYKLNLPGKQQTERIIRAMDNPYFTILGHPTGRMINQRLPYEINMELILKAAKERGCIIELNASPERLDLNDIYCKAAKDIGVKIAISTDAHSTSDLGLMRFGINQARRGWLEPGDVVNTRTLKELRKLFNRVKHQSN